MADSMEFPKTMEEFIDGYSFNDSDKIYTNGVDLIPTYRVIQGFGHYEKEIRNKAIEEFAERIIELDGEFSTVEDDFGELRPMTINEMCSVIAEQMKGE